MSDVIARIEGANERHARILRMRRILPHAVHESSMSREDMVAKAREALDAEFDRQREDGFGNYYDNEFPGSAVIDGTFDLNGLAAAVVDAVVDILGPPF